MMCLQESLVALVMIRIRSVDSDGTCEVLDLGQIFVHCTSIAWSDACEFGLGSDSTIGST